MQDTMRSMFRFSWAMSMFGACQAANLLAPGRSNWTIDPASAFDAVSEAAERQIGFQNSMFSQAEAGNNLAPTDNSGYHTSPTPSGVEVAYGGLITSTENMHTEPPISLHIRLGNTTQGPFWPPAAQTNEDGDFILVGTVLREVKPGVVIPVPRQAVIVSKDTVPPLDSQGRENFSNLFGAPYNVIRELDLNQGSPDLDLVIHTVSWGPFEGDWGGGGPRMPRLGESRYNLNSFHTNGITSPEIFPASSQRFTYTRPRFPLHKFPIPGFQGDQIAYDIDTGEPYTPRLRGGADCPPDGCEGEDLLHYRREEPITLGEWLRAEVWLTITLTNFKRTKGTYGVYTAARFDVQARNLLPNSFYAVMFIRASQFHPSPLRKIPDASVLPNIMITDYEGKARLSRVIPNPFPNPATDGAGLRIVGVGIGFKPDFAVWGAYPFRFNPGVDIHAQITSFADGLNTELTSFITEAA